MSRYASMAAAKSTSRLALNGPRPGVPGLVDTIAMQNVFLHYPFVLPRLALEHEPCAGQPGLGYLIVQQVVTGTKLVCSHLIV